MCECRGRRGEAEGGNGPVDRCPVERACQGRHAPGFRAQRDCEAMKAQERPRAKKSYLPWVSHPQVAFKRRRRRLDESAVTGGIMADLRRASNAFLTGNHRVRSRYRPCFCPHEYAMSPKKKPRIAGLFLVPCVIPGASTL